MKKIINFLIFQFIWLTCIAGVATNHESLGILFGLSGVALNVYRSHALKRDLDLLWKGLLLGIVIDTFLIQFNLIAFNSHFWHAVSPLWMWVIWTGFLSTLHDSLSWLHGRWILAAFLGAVMGPLSYWSGVSLGAAHFQDLNQSLLVIGIVWLIATPLIFKMSQASSRVD
jgi:hypothetical protein